MQAVAVSEVQELEKVDYGIVEFEIDSQGRAEGVQARADGGRRARVDGAGHRAAGPRSRGSAQQRSEPSG